MDNKNGKFNGLIILSILFVAMVIIAISDGFKGIMVPLVKDAFQASYQETGLFNSAISLGNVTASLIAAYLLSRIGLKKTMIAGYVIVFAVMSSFPLIGSFSAATLAYTLLRFGFVIYLMGINGLAATSSSSPGKMLTLTHFFYGFGAIFGPSLASYLISNNVFTWKTIYTPVSLAVIVSVILTLIVKIPKQENPKESSKGGSVSILEILKMPEVWLFGIASSFLGQLETATMTWGVLYLKDALGADPVAVGATFLTVFFLCFAIARFVSGFVIEKIGYVRTELLSIIFTILIMLLGFLLGQNGIWVLAASGFPAAVIWPTLLAIISRIYKEHAPVYMSMILFMCGTVSIFMQALTGWVNQNIGAQWGYPYLLLPGTVGLVLFVLLIKFLRKKGKIAT